MYINHRIIKFYQENSIKELLQKINIHDAFINRINRYQDKTEIKSHEMSLIDFTEDYLITEILKRYDTLNKETINIFRDKLWNLYNEDHFIVYDSKFFHKEIAEKIFAKEQLEEIKAFKMQTTLKIIGEMTDLFKKKNQTVPEFVFRVAEYQIKVNDANNGNLCDKLYNYLLNNFEENNNMYAKEFILHYTAYLVAQDLEVPMPYVYISNYGLADERLPKNSAGVSSGNSGMIVLNRELIKNNISGEEHIPSIISFMHVVAHEVRHSNQAYRAEKGEESLVAFDYIRSVVFRQYLSEKDYNEYRENYQHSEIESDAEQYGWRIICEIIKSRIKNENNYLAKVFKEAESASNNDLISIKQEKDKTKLETWAYNVKKLNEIVAKNTDILTTHPQLKLIYNSDGSVKDIFELLQNENNNPNNKKELAKIYNDYYINFIANNGLNTLDPTKLPENTQIQLFEKIADLANEEYQKLTTTMKIYNKYSEDEKKEFDLVNSNRAERIKNMIEYLKKYQTLINKLKNTTIETKLTTIGKNMEKFQNEYYLAIFQGLYSSQAHQNIETLKEVKYNDEKHSRGRK